MTFQKARIRCSEKLHNCIRRRTAAAEKKQGKRKEEDEAEAQKTMVYETNQSNSFAKGSAITSAKGVSEDGSQIQLEDWNTIPSIFHASSF